MQNVAVIWNFALILFLPCETHHTNYSELFVEEYTQLTTKWLINWNQFFFASQSQGRACCVCDSVDGRYIFIGQPRGLSAVDVQTQEKVASWEEESVDIHYVKAYLIGVQVYLVVTIDDMGNKEISVNTKFMYENDFLSIKCKKTFIWIIF